MTTKISAAQAFQVYSEVPGVLRGLVEERDNLLSKVASLRAELEEYKVSDRIEKIAHTMDDKHIDNGVSFDEKVERIKEAHASGRSLDVIEEAVDMTAPQGGMAHLGNELETGNGAVELESYLLGGIG
jgi:ribosomal protein S1